MLWGKTLRQEIQQCRFFSFSISLRNLLWQKATTKLCRFCNALSLVTYFLACNPYTWDNSIWPKMAIDKTVCPCLKDTSQELFNVCLDKATMKIWHYRKMWPSPPLPLPIPTIHTPASVSDFEEFRLSWDGEGDTRPRTQAETPWSTLKFPNNRISSILEFEQWIERYLLCCTSFACYWNSQKHSSKPIFLLRCPVPQMQVIDHSEKISLSKQHPVKIKRSLFKCLFPYQKAFL